MWEMVNELVHESFERGQNIGLSAAILATRNSLSLRTEFNYHLYFMRDEPNQ